MSDTPTAIDHVIASVPDIKRVVFLVGAGLSVKSGFDLWPQATLKALEAARKRGLSDAAYLYATEKLNARDLYGVFGILEESLTTAAYRSVVLSTFTGRNEANDTQKLLVSIPARGIITTNFDECLSAARVLVHGETALSSMREIIASTSYFLAQPHGSLRDFQSMVLTKRDWERVLHEGILRQLLEQVVSQNQLIILGYGMADPDFLRIWQDLLSERIFSETALLCCSTGSLSSSQIADYKLKNIQVIEFDDPDHKFSYVDEILKAFVVPVGTVTKASISPTISKKVDELERYVLICMEFAPNQVSRLELVCRAVLLEQLIVKGVPHSEKDLVSHVTSTLGESSQTIVEATKAALSSLVRDGSVVYENGALSLTDSARAAINKKVKAADVEEFSVLTRVLETFKLPPTQPQLSIDVFQALVDRTFASFGMEVAEFFLYSRPAKIPSEKIDGIVNDYCAPLHIVSAARVAYAEAIKCLVIQPEDDYAPVVFKKLQAYFVTSAYVLNPSSEKLLADYASGHIVYLDASIILPAIAIGHTSHPLYRSMLSSTSRLGMKLRVSREMLNEVAHNIHTANSAFKTFTKSSADMQDILAGYLTLQGRGNGNVFIEGFAAELELDPNLSPAAYMRLVIGDADSSDAAVGKMLRERYEIELDRATEADLDRSEITRLAATIAHIRKLGNRFKTDLLCRHEAVQFALIHMRRSKQPELVSKIWFITTDFFFAELQRLEIIKYPLPVSYTPRLWFQYLNLLDHEARGSKHYSRLQQRMRYGVAVGGLGLAAIYQILTKKKANRQGSGYSAGNGSGYCRRVSRSTLNRCLRLRTTSNWRQGRFFRGAFQAG
jgi:SIR2-like domain